jgi:hypothetical protein
MIILYISKNQQKTYEKNSCSISFINFYTKINAQEYFPNNGVQNRNNNYTALSMPKIFVTQHK